MLFSDQVQIGLEMVTLFAWLISTPKQSFKLAFMCQHGNISLLAETKREWFFYDHPTRNIWMFSWGLCRESMFLVLICWDLMTYCDFDFVIFTIFIFAWFKTYSQQYLFVCLQIAINSCIWIIKETRKGTLCGSTMGSE